MILNIDTVVSALHGHRFYEINDEGYTVFYRFSHELIENHLKLTKDFYERCFDTTGMIFKFRTDSFKFGFDYFLDWINAGDSVDVYINGTLKVHFPVNKENTVGKFECTLVPESDIENNKRSMNEIWVYLPNYSRLSVKNIEIDDGCVFEPVDTQNQRRVLILGDSITQGSGIGWSSLTYANTVSRLLGWESRNLAIGGYSFYAEGFEPQYFNPDMIFISLGTNSCRSPLYESRLISYLDKLEEMYPDVPAVMISPIYRETPNVEFVYEIMRRNTENRKNITLINGYSFVPHIPEFYRDGCHPTLTGGGILASAVIAAIKDI